MIKCMSCGAEFDPREAQCPYCGTIYVPGAEKQYMETLGDLREDMEKLGDDAFSGTGAEMKAVAGRMLKGVLIAIAVVAALAVISSIVWFVRNYVFYLW